MAKQAGYATAMLGKMHFGNDPWKYGAEFHCVCRYWEGYDGPNHTKDGNRGGMYGNSWFRLPGLILNGVGIPTTEDDFGPDIERKNCLGLLKPTRTGLLSLIGQPICHTWSGRAYGRAESAQSWH